MEYVVQTYRFLLHQCYCFIQVSGLLEKQPQHWLNIVISGNITAKVMSLNVAIRRKIAFSLLSVAASIAEFHECIFMLG